MNLWVFKFLLSFSFVVIVGCEGLSLRSQCKNLTPEKKAYEYGSLGLSNKTVLWSQACEKKLEPNSHEKVYLKALKEFCFKDESLSFRVQHGLEPIRRCVKYFTEYKYTYDDKKQVFCDPKKAETLLYLQHLNLLKFCSSQASFNEKANLAQSNYCRKTNLIFFGKSGRKYPELCQSHKESYYCARFNFLKSEIKKTQVKLKLNQEQEPEGDQIFSEQESLRSLLSQKQKIEKEYVCP